MHCNNQLINNELVYELKALTQHYEPHIEKNSLCIK